MVIGVKYQDLEYLNKKIREELDLFKSNTKNLSTTVNKYLISSDSVQKDSWSGEAAEELKKAFEQEFFIILDTIYYNLDILRDYMVDSNEKYQAMDKFKKGV